MLPRGLVNENPGGRCYAIAVLQVLMRNKDIMKCLNNDNSDFKQKLFELRDKFYNNDIDPATPIYQSFDNSGLNKLEIEGLTIDKYAIHPGEFMKFAEGQNVNMDGGAESSIAALEGMLEKIENLADNDMYYDFTRELHEIHKNFKQEIENFVKEAIISQDTREPGKITNVLDTIDNSRQRIKTNKYTWKYAMYRWVETMTGEYINELKNLLSITFQVTHKQSSIPKFGKCPNDFIHTFFYVGELTIKVAISDKPNSIKNLNQLVHEYIQNPPYTDNLMNTENRCECNPKQYKVEKEIKCWVLPKYIFVVIESNEFDTVTDYEKLELQEYSASSSGQLVRYSLIATIWHHGDTQYRADIGHFSATIKVGNKWYHFNDDKANEVSSGMMYKSIRQQHNMPIILEYERQ